MDKKIRKAMKANDKKMKELIKEDIPRDRKLKECAKMKKSGMK